MPNDYLSGKGKSVVLSAEATYSLRSREQGLQILQQALKNPTDLTHSDVEYLSYVASIWEAAKDPNYTPPEHFSEQETFPLYQRGGEAANAGQYEEAIRHCWTYLQYCPIGSIRYSSTLEILTELLFTLENTTATRHAAEMCLSHYNLLKSTTNLALPSVKRKAMLPEWEMGSEEIPVEPFLPWSIALKMIDRDDSPCWVSILELKVDHFQPDVRDRGPYKAVVSALRRYYEKNGNKEALNHLEATHPLS
jgi:hypothetical protein